jgi:hypothetical protein
MTWSDRLHKYGPWLCTLVAWAVVAIVATQTGKPVPPPPAIPLKADAPSNVSPTP